MNNFKIKNLVGVLVVSATMLLTGCNIEALGNFGKATAVLENYNSVFEESYEACIFVENLRNQKNLYLNSETADPNSKIEIKGTYKIARDCDVWKNSGKSLATINKNIATYGKLLAAFEEDANVDMKSLISEIKKIKSFVEGEDKDALKKINLDNLDNKDALGSMNKLVNMFRVGARELFKAISKEKLVSNISTNLCESRSSVETYFEALNLAVTAYESQLSKELKVEFKQLEGLPLNESYKSFKESQILLEKANEFISKRNQNLTAYKTSLAKVNENYKDLIFIARYGVGKNKFDGQNFKDKMMEFLTEVKEILEDFKL